MKYLFFFIFISSVAFAQLTKDYVPIIDLPESKEKIAKEILSKTKSDLINFPSGNYSKIKKEYLNRAQYISNSLSSDKFIINSTINDLLLKTSKEIAKNNPEINLNNLRFFVSRDPESNAICLGEGTIVVNLGLFNTIENESQLAFVLAHEIAHFQLNHVNNEIFRKIEGKNKKEENRNVVALGFEKYERYTKALEYYKKSLYNDKKVTRQKEIEADSLAMVYLSKTNFDSKQALNCLALLDKVDEDKVENNSTIADFFKTFDAKATLKENEISTMSGFYKFDVSKIVDLDSIKTHPDCKDRIILIKNQYKIEAEENSNEISESVNNVKELVEFELVAFDFKNKYFASSLTRSIKLLKKYPNNTFANLYILKNLNQISEDLRKHSFPIDFSYMNEKNSKEYVEVNDFIQNSNLKTITDFTYKFAKNGFKNFKTNEDFVFQAYLSAKNAKDEALKKETVLHYRSKFPQGKYFNLIQ